VTFPFVILFVLQLLTSCPPPDIQPVISLIFEKERGQKVPLLILWALANS